MVKQTGVLLSEQFSADIRSIFGLPSSNFVYTPWRLGGTVKLWACFSKYSTPWLGCQVKTGNRKQESKSHLDIFKYLERVTSLERFLYVHLRSVLTALSMLWDLNEISKNNSNSFPDPATQIPLLLLSRWGIQITPALMLPSAATYLFWLHRKHI